MLLREDRRDAHPSCRDAHQAEDNVEKDVHGDSPYVVPGEVSVRRLETFMNPVCNCPMSQSVKSCNGL
jgi:hypothetical protein